MNEVVKRGYDLTARNPSRMEQHEYELPEVLLSKITERERQISELLEELRQALNRAE